MGTGFDLKVGNKGDIESLGGPEPVESSCQHLMASARHEDRRR
jgi:hypothetical protein